MTEEELDRIFEIFYENAPYNYVLAIHEQKKRGYRGLTCYDTQTCTIWGEDKYLDALWVCLHELAHAKIQHKTHSAAWDKEFVDLLDRYDYPKDQVRHQAEAIGPSLKAWAGI